jgi:Spy/CpxP family protein refolding chaperone
MKRSIVILALFVAPLAARLDAQGPPGQQQGPQPGQQQDPFGRFLFPPELVMQHQGEINLQDSQRSALQAAIQQAQSKFVDVQWKLSAEGEKLARLLQGATVDETQVLEQVDRILALEREMKRAQMGLMIRIKNTLSAAQQAKLRELRG